MKTSKTVKSPAVTKELVEKEISRCILLGKDDKKRWHDLAAAATPIMLASIYRLVKNKNDLNDKFILEAFKLEPKLLEQLKNKVANIKKGTLKIKEEEERPKEMEDLEKQMQEL